VTAALSVPKKFYFEVPGTPDLKKIGTLTTPGVQQKLIEFTVPTGINKVLFRAIVVCRMESKFSVLMDGELIGSGRTGAACPSADFDWLPGLPVNPGQKIELLFTARPHSPVVDVEAYLQTSDLS
jgi:hypothetical protein